MKTTPTKEINILTAVIFLMKKWRYLLSFALGFSLVGIIFGSNSVYEGRAAFSIGYIEGSNASLEPFDNLQVLTSLINAKFNRGSNTNIRIKKNQTDLNIKNRLILEISIFDESPELVIELAQDIWDLINRRSLSNQNRLIRQDIDQITKNLDEYKLLSLELNKVMKMNIGDKFKKYLSDSVSKDISFHIEKYQKLADNHQPNQPVLWWHPTTIIFLPDVNSVRKVNRWFEVAAGMFSIGLLVGSLILIIRARKSWY